MEARRRHSVQQTAPTHHQCLGGGFFTKAWKDISIVTIYKKVTNGVKQGCVLAPTLFSIFLSALLDEAFRDMGDGVYLQSRQSADLFNVAHFRAKTKTIMILMRELLFADDSALVAHSAEEMQKNRGCFSNASKKFGLMINIKKTKVLYQPNSTRTTRGDNKLNSVQEFTYLRSTISSNG